MMSANVFQQASGELTKTYYAHLGPGQPAAYQRAMFGGEACA